MRARLESPRASYATPGHSGTTRAPRQRQLPTNHGHADRLVRATRAYQPDSSSKTPHPPLRAVNLRKLSRTLFKLRRSDPPKNLLDGRSFHISWHWRNHSYLSGPRSSRREDQKLLPAKLSGYVRSRRVDQALSSKI